MRSCIWILLRSSIWVFFYKTSNIDISVCFCYVVNIHLLFSGRPYLYPLFAITIDSTDGILPCILAYIPTVQADKHTDIYNGSFIIVVLSVVLAYVVCVKKGNQTMSINNKTVTTGSKPVGYPKKAQAIGPTLARRPFKKQTMQSIIYQALLKEPRAIGNPKMQVDLVLKIVKDKKLEKDTESIALLQALILTVCIVINLWLTTVTTSLL